MDLAENSEPAEPAGKSRQKRSRTGCLTCRTRRRKCDEGKPQCQSCLSKGLECRYAAAFQILGKNNFTPEVPSKRRGYAELQFISGYTNEYKGKETEKDKKKKTSRLSSEPVGTDLLSPQSVRSAESLGEARPQSASAERYEFALHGLLALGNANGGDPEEPEATFTNIAFPQTERVALPNHTSVGVDPPQRGSSTISAGDFQNTPRIQSWPSMTAISSVEIPQKTDENILECLRYYRYHIAPWMDICDMSQCFGREVPQLSNVSSPVQHKLLLLAESSFNARQQDHQLNTDADMLPHVQRQENSAADIVHQALLDILDTVNAVITNLSEFWNGPDSTWRSQRVLEPLLPEVNEKFSNDACIRPAVFWLMARLQLSGALLDPSTVRTPLPATSISAWDYISAGNAERVFRYAHDVVALCIDATIFSRGDEDRWLQQQYGLDRVELWRTLVAGFDRWYKHRPQDFQPIVELYPKDGVTSEHGFPTLVFSSGGTTLANQLYHTGMLLLLQNKPRFINRPNSQSPSMSVLWHAHRVCGISLSNDRWDCWDPSLVASLLVAAKTVTHQSQHKAILDTLERIQKITGWNISYHVEELVLEWQQAEGW